MSSYEDFPIPEKDLWATLLRKELREVPSGLPKPFYQKSDAPNWAKGEKLPFVASWKLVSDMYIPSEVDVWRYAPPIPQPAPPIWYISTPSPARVPDSVTAYVVTPLTDRPSLGIPIWQMPLRLTEDLRLEGLADLKALRPHLGNPLHLQLTLGDAFFGNILLIRSLKKALLQTTQTEILLWTEPDRTLLEIDTSLPGASLEENLIRLTTYAFSAVLGGGQYIYLPAIRAEDAHAQRWSRAISHILRYEVADLWGLPDPLAGSFYLEAESNRIAEQIYQTLTS